MALSTACSAVTLIAAALLISDIHAATSQPAGADWWRHAVIYEIYPRSFQDSDGDGIGDLRGITSHLDYLQELGVDALWIAPMYPSPQVDFGYDISDYRAVDPQFGSLADLDQLIAQATQRHMRVILDLVLNHTSDQHPWFVEAARSRESPPHDFYVWQPRLPNNWVSLFGGSAWQYVPAVGQFYYHRFYRQQPDLNWRNPAVERSMFDVARFWLNRGVAGFRLDAITSLFEDPELRDEPETGGRNAQGDPNLAHVYTDNLPGVHAVMRRLRALVDSYHDGRLLIGETYLASTRDLDSWYGGARHDELQLPMDMLVGFAERLDANVLRSRLAELETEIHGSVPLLVFDNHDNVRSWNRYGDGVHDLAIAKLVAALSLTSRGSALLYQGQEIGQRTAAPARIEDVRDPIGISGWPREKGRDGERTPMQWRADLPQAGFSTSAHTWLPVSGDYRQINVETERADPHSLLNAYRRLLQLRRSQVALREGRTVMLQQDSRVLSYARMAGAGDDVVLVSLNVSPESCPVELSPARAQLPAGTARTLWASEDDLTPRGNRLMLPPYAAWVGVLRARR
jgi:alpha-glucosidase